MQRHWVCNSVSATGWVKGWFVSQKTDNEGVRRMEIRGPLPLVTQEEYLVDHISYFLSSPSMKDSELSQGVGALKE